MSSARRFWEPVQFSNSAIDVVLLIRHQSILGTADTISDV